MLEFVIILLSAFLIGYFVGKCVGCRQGMVEGKSAAVLILRQKSFEQGYCSLCKASGVVESGIVSNHSTHTKDGEW
ncbi:hypothetical protein SDC9_06128 [bioreactor metagenome]|uniref:Uncharacterized protein n=1 Tax=bioreactor metagenome TaxID=1076179 RepID=A0A644T237_9ZZZZ